MTAETLLHPPSLNGDAREHAALLRGMGFALCRLDPAEKKPTYERWGKRSLEPADFRHDDMIGILSGPLSDGGHDQHALVIIDLDTAPAVQKADDYLPPTAMEEGRAGRPRSHRYYLLPFKSIPAWAVSTAEQGAQAAIDEAGHAGPVKKAFCHAATDARVIDFLGTGGQAVCPPSMHASGETREWTGGKPGQPAVVAFDLLWVAVCRLAQACGCKTPSGRTWPWEDAPAPKPFVEREVHVGDVERRAIAYLRTLPPAISGQGGHDKTFAAARVVAWGFDLGAEVAFQILKQHFNPTCQPEWSDTELWHKVSDADRLPCQNPRGHLRDAERRGHTSSTKASTAGITPNEAPDDPHRLARLYIAERCTHADGLTLRFWRDEWHQWDGSAYRVVPKKELRAELTASAKEEMDRVNLVSQLTAPDKEPPTVRKVTGRMIADVEHALISLTVLPSRSEAPGWIGTEEPFPADEYLACRNGLIHLPSFVAGQNYFTAPTPRFFSLNCLDFDFDAQAPRPTAWLAFLDELWPGDAQSIDTLQEWEGYLLTPDTRQHKILTLLGPKRSGKGTIARVTRGLIGAANIAGPTLSSFSTNFGLWPLVGKTVAMISDARLSGRTDSAVVTERLLSISGEDALTIDRKNLPPVTVKLASRLMILTNELPRLSDSSGALTGRMILLRLTQSWYGKEDTALSARLMTELPGILLWAIEGWRRLRERGRFMQPDEGREMLAELDDLASPIGAFVRERCHVGPGLRATTADLFAEWKRWCESNGRKEPGTAQTFGRDLHAAIPSIRRRRPRDGDERHREYEGIGLNPI
jgi:putative DNA primase/helicase